MIFQVNELFYVEILVENMKLSICHEIWEIFKKCFQPNPLYLDFPFGEYNVTLCVFNEENLSFMKKKLNELNLMKKSSFTRKKPIKNRIFFGRKFRRNYNVYNFKTRFVF